MMPSEWMWASPDESEARSFHVRASSRPGGEVSHRREAKDESLGVWARSERKVDRSPPSARGVWMCSRPACSQLESKLMTLE